VAEAAVAATGVAAEAATVTEETGAMEAETTEGDTIPGGPHHPTTVAAAVAAEAGGETTGRGPDLILHVVIEQNPEMQWSPGFLLLLNAASGHNSTLL